MTLLHIFLNFLLQISVPHNEADKVPRGGLENMTLVEVCSYLLLNICTVSGNYRSSLNLKMLLYRLVPGSAWTQLRYSVAALEDLPYTRIHFSYHQIRYSLVSCPPSVSSLPFCTYNFLSIKDYAHQILCFQIRALEKRKKAGKYAKKVKAKTRRKMHELSNPLEPDEFADMWKE